MLTEAYMQRALLAAVLTAPLCALLGVFVTARRMAFFGETVAHAALAGVALGLWLGVAEPTVPFVAAGLGVAALILWLKERTDLATDTVMAMLLSGSVALGIIVLSLLKASRGDTHRLLFGDILAVTPLDLWLGALVLGTVGAAALTHLSELTLWTAHEELAHVCGVPVRRLNQVFIVVLTVTVALSIRLLGIVLVTALLVIPPAAAGNLSRNFRQHILGSLIVGLAAGVTGVVAAYHLDVPCGPAMVLACLAAFGLTLLLRRRRGRTL